MRRLCSLLLNLCAFVLIFVPMVRATDTQSITPGNVYRIMKLRSLAGHTGYVRDVAFSPDGAHLASSGDDRSVRLWNVTTGEEVHLFRTPGCAAYINSLAFSPDGGLLASPRGIWDLNSCVLANEFDLEMMHVAFSPGGALLAVGSILEPVQLLDTSTWSVVRSFESFKHIDPAADNSFGFEFSPDGTLLADGTLGAGDVRVWSVESGLLMQTFSVSRPDTDVHDVSFSPDGQLLAGGGQGLSVCLFRVEDGIIEREFPTGEGTMSLDFSPDGQLLAISCEGVVSLWSIETGRRLRSLRHENTVLPVAFSPDGKYLACGVRGGEVAIWGLQE